MTGDDAGPGTGASADSDPTRVAACQLAVADLAVAANLETVADRVDGLPPAVELAVFPEYALTGFVADERLRDAALARDGEAIDRLRDRAAAADLTLVVGFVERAGEEAELYNATAVVSPDGEVTVYRKRHLWGGEREWLTPGDERVVVDTPAGRAGVLTCYDLNFVGESAALTREAADLLLVPGAWPAAHAENWRLLCRARALDGVRWVVAAGRTGRRDLADATTVDYAGRSQVVRPDGTVMAACNRDERDVLATLDPADLADSRASIPVLDHARDDAAAGTHPD